MALTPKSTKLGPARPAGGYSTTTAVHDAVTLEPVSPGKLRLANAFTAVRGAFKSSLPQRQAKGSLATGQGSRRRGGKTQTDPKLAGKPRTIVPRNTPTI